MATLLTIGEVSRRSGVAASALRFYEDRGLITSERAGAGHRRYPRPVLRRIAFIVFAQRIGLTLEEIGTELEKLPPQRVAEPPRLVTPLAGMEHADRCADRRARAPEERPHRMHRVRMPVPGALPAGQSRRPRRPARPRPALLGRRPPAALTAGAGGTVIYPSARSMRSLLRAHWPLLVVLAFAATVRAAVAIAYRPAIFFGDSWAYLDLAYGGSPVAFAPDRPSGYPILIDLLSIFGRSLGAITTAQHLAGLLTGVIVYALLVRLRVPRWLATAGAAVVLLDAYAIALEQQILAEAFFTVALAASFFLVVGRDRGPAALAASGVLLAAATTMRTAAVFAVPVWLLYVLWAHRRPRLIGPAALGLMLPLLAYASWHAADTGRFGLTQADGWFLYGRVGEIADCGNADVPSAARPLCNRNARDRREGAAYHIWNADGPARRTFGGMSSDPDRQAQVERCAARLRAGDHPRPAG